MGEKHLMRALPQNRPRLSSYGTISGAPVSVGGVTVRPLARSLTLRYGPAVLVWQRPSAVLVSTDEGTSRIPIIDWTRAIQAAIALGIVLCTCGFLLSKRRRKGR